MDVKLKHITRVESVRGDDYYATPFVATDALLSVEDFVGSIWEPCCGEGHISRRLEEFGYDVESTDFSMYRVARLHYY